MDFDERLRDLLAGLPRLVPGHVWLVGAGPGDPGYLTLHAIAALRDADVIVHDALIDARVLALAGPETRIEPAGKRGHQPSAEQDAISARLVELARQNARVVRLKGGDPFMFGRAGEEMLALAGTAAALIPPTLRGVNQAVIFATGHGAGDGPRIDWASLAATRQPLVIYMAMHQLPGITADLVRGGLAPETPAVIVASATLPQERILVSRLDRIAAEAQASGVGAPAVVVIGEVVAMRARLLGLVSAGPKGATP
jgi:uroporphyrin-III C-methyltransferase